jgi:hypothetical protein
MNVIARRLPLGLLLAVLALALSPVPGDSINDIRPVSLQASHQIVLTSVRAAARRGIELLIDRAQRSFLAWDPYTGLWGHHSKPNWWQSALALQTLVRYAERTGDNSATIQNVILNTYARTVEGLDGHPSLWRRHFADQFMDDTAWWAIGWLDAARYELYDQHDISAAADFLSIVEWDTRYIASQRRPCGGVEWEMGTPPDVATNAEYASLTAGLAAFLNLPGPFYDRLQAAHWLHQAQHTMEWMVRVRLVNMKAGMVRGRLGPRCRGLRGGAITYTEGEVAEALTQLGNADHDPLYYRHAGNFIRYTLSPRSRLVEHGVLREHCELRAGGCQAMPAPLDIPAYKGIFMDAVSDWLAATGSTRYYGFLGEQADSLLTVDARPGYCQADVPAGCRFAYEWVTGRGGGMASWVTVGSQESAIEALTAAIH